jgi:nitroreductase
LLAIAKTAWINIIVIESKMENSKSDIMPELLKRRSIRKFNTKAVGKNKLDRILKAAQLAPSAKNRQEWRFIVVQNASLKNKIKEAAFGQEHVGQAPVIVAACTTNIHYRMPNGELSYPIDIAFAASSMLLQATREGLGSCVVTTYDEHEIKDLLNIPYSMKVMLLILFGYYDHEPELQSRKTLRRIVSYEHW